MENNIYLNADFRQKDQVKALGARYDATRKQWYISKNQELHPFKKWLPVEYRLNLVESNQPVNVVETAKQHLTISELRKRIAGEIASLFPNDIWIVGEIVKIKVNNNYLQLELQDDEAFLTEGKKYTLRINIWKEKVDFIQNKLFNSCGLHLAEKQKVRIKVKVAFHLEYDLSGTAHDLDPELTMGQIALQQKKIKELLIKEGIFNKNKLLGRPLDFSRVIVIHPDNASGFHDFLDAARNLSKLCTFQYIISRFEGANVESDMEIAFSKALEEHQKSPIDALIIIRGGGARQGLLSLITEKIIRNICTFPAPVFIGVGHTEDILLLDEVANTSFGTPSKVIEHISSTIIEQAKAAKASWDFIVSNVINKITHKKNEIKNYKSDINLFSIKYIAIHRTSSDDLHNNIKYFTNRNIEHIKLVLGSASNDISNKSLLKLQQYRERLETNFNMSRNRAMSIIQGTKENLQVAKNSIATKAQSILNHHAMSLSKIKERFKADIQNSLVTTNRNISQFMINIKSDLYRHKNRLIDKLNSSYEAIEALSPEQTLKRGYCLSLGTKGVIKTAKSAYSEKQFRVKFIDGECSVLITEKEAT